MHSVLINASLETLKNELLCPLLHTDRVQNVLIARICADKMVHDDRLRLPLPMQTLIRLLIQFKAPVQTVPDDMVATVL